MLDYDLAPKLRKMENPVGLFGALEVAQRQWLIAIVVITDARMNNAIKKGNDFFRLKPEALLPSFFACFARANASTSVIGIIARVRVSFTVTALSSV